MKHSILNICEQCAPKSFHGVEMHGRDLARRLSLDSRRGRGKWNRPSNLQLPEWAMQRCASIRKKQRIVHSVYVVEQPVYAEVACIAHVVYVATPTPVRITTVGEHRTSKCKESLNRVPRAQVYAKALQSIKRTLGRIQRHSISSAI